MSLRSLDHLVVAAHSLEAGCSWVERNTHVRPDPGGQHLSMGTHNALLSLGPDAYLEVISIDSNLPEPDRPRWFALDSFQGPPRLIHWVCRVPDLAAIHHTLPAETGPILPMSRGDLHWKLTVPDDGSLPFGGTYPTHLEWTNSPGAAPRLPDKGVRLKSLTLRGPVPPPLDDPSIQWSKGPAHLAATFTQI